MELTKRGCYTILDMVSSERTDMGQYVRMFRVRCNCGAEYIKYESALGPSAAPKHCRACRVNKNAEYKHPLYSRWSNMIARCYNPKEPAFKYYGGRGIKVCEHWLGKRADGERATKDGFAQFLRDMGECPPEFTIERLDVNGDYTPDNCVWASRIDQAYNKRTTRRYMVDGVPMTILELMRATGKEAARLRYALQKYGEVTCPPRKRKEMKLLDPVFVAEYRKILGQFDSYQ